MPEHVTFMRDLIDNIRTFDSWKTGSIDERRQHARSMKNVRYFVVARNGESFTFAPGNFVMYKDNTFADRWGIGRRRRGQSGGEPTRVLFPILQAPLRTGEGYEQLERTYLGGYSPSVDRTGLRSRAYWLVEPTEEPQEPQAETDRQNFSAEEGCAQDQSRRFRTRNSVIIEERKRQDEYTCQSCYFQMIVGGAYVIDCHHKNPLHQGHMLSNIEDLVSLCPTCHRIAHSQTPPLSLEEIRAAREAAGIPEFAR
jgi:hypothetical protein